MRYAFRRGIRRDTWKPLRNSTRIWQSKSQQSRKAARRIRNRCSCRESPMVSKECGLFQRYWGLRAMTRRGRRFQAQSDWEYEGSGLKSLRRDLKTDPPAAEAALIPPYLWHG